MRKLIRVAVTVLAAGSLVLAACGDDSDDKGSGDTSGGDSGGTKIGVILPDSKSSARWETADRKFLDEAIAGAGFEAVIQNAEGDKQKITAKAIKARHMFSHAKMRPGPNRLNSLPMTVVRDITSASRSRWMMAFWRSAHRWITRRGAQPTSTPAWARYGRSNKNFSAATPCAMIIWAVRWLLLATRSPWVRAATISVMASTKARLMFLSVRIAQSLHLGQTVCRMGFRASLTIIN